jgi:hypothetical protein
MKIREISRKEGEEKIYEAKATNTKYAQAYTALGKLPMGKSLEIEFESKKESTSAANAMRAQLKKYPIDSAEFTIHICDTKLICLPTVRVAE